jgi:imidazolonepropionase-like amidohydrolase
MHERVACVFGAMCCFLATIVFGQEHPAPPPKTWLLSHVTIVDVTQGRATPNLAMVIAGGRIQSIGPQSRTHVARNAQVVDADGKFVIPGLWDLHVHLANDSSAGDWARQVSLPLLAANGVTGVRDMGGDLATLTSLRREIEAGSSLGPRIIVSGPTIKSSNLDEDGARRAVASLKQSGVDFIKIMSWVPRDAYFAVADEAKKRKIPFAGHVPELVSASEASEAGQHSMEHLLGIWQSCSVAEFALRQTMTEATEHRSSAPPYVFARVEFDLPPRGALDTFSLDRATQLFERFARNGTWQVPTLVEDAAFALSVTNRVLDQPGMKFVPSLMRKSWNLSKLLENLEAEDRNDLVRIGSKRLQLVEAMHRAGVNILPGTDAPWLVVPGFSLHDELFLLVQAGLTPTDALRAATWDAAKFLGLQSSLGSVEAGKFADLVLLDANPLEDIRNTQKISGVFMQGRWFNRRALDGLLREVEAQSKTR